MNLLRLHRFLRIVKEDAPTVLEETLEAHSALVKQTGGWEISGAGWAFLAALDQVEHRFDAGENGAGVVAGAAHHHRAAIVDQWHDLTDATEPHA